MSDAHWFNSARYRSISACLSYRLLTVHCCTEERSFAQTPAYLSAHAVEMTVQLYNVPPLAVQFAKAQSPSKALFSCWADLVAGLVMSNLSRFISVCEVGSDTLYACSVVRLLAYTLKLLTRNITHGSRRIDGVAGRTQRGWFSEYLLASCESQQHHIYQDTGAHPFSAEYRV